MKILKNYAAKAIKQLNINLWYSRPEEPTEEKKLKSNKTNECVPDVDDDVDVRWHSFRAAVAAEHSNSLVNNIVSIMLVDYRRW